jgi:hypothetical protein
MEPATPCKKTLQAGIDGGPTRFSPRVVRNNPRLKIRFLLFKFQEVDSYPLDKGAGFIYFAIQSESPMRELDRALGEITSIRRQMARATEFRGYGAATLACTGLLAVAAAVAQAYWLPDAAGHLAIYLGIWTTTAVLSASVIAVQTVNRAQRMHSGMADEMIRMAVEQFLPAAIAGSLLTVAMMRLGPSHLSLLPGLWQVIFSLGVFSSCRFLPRPMLAAGVWYLATGLICVALGDARALSPWAMGVPYGAGQFLVAAILYFNQEANTGGEPQ